MSDTGPLYNFAQIHTRTGKMIEARTALQNWVAGQVYDAKVTLSDPGGTLAYFATEVTAEITSPPFKGKPVTNPDEIAFMEVM